MLNEKRVKHMVKLASYENKRGEEDLKISSYFKKDYISFNVLISLMWATFGYISLVGILCVTYMDEILNKLTFSNAILYVAGFIITYVITLIIYGAIAKYHYTKKYLSARHNVKRFIRDLEALEKMYEREEA